MMGRKGRGVMRLVLGGMLEGEGLDMRKFAAVSISATTRGVEIGAHSAIFLTLTLTSHRGIGPSKEVTRCIVRWWRGQTSNSSREQWVVWIYFKSWIEETKRYLVGWELGKQVVEVTQIPKVVGQVSKVCQVGQIANVTQIEHTTEILVPQWVWWITLGREIGIKFVGGIVGGVSC